MLGQNATTVKLGYNNYFIDNMNMQSTDIRK